VPGQPRGPVLLKTLVMQLQVRFLQARLAWIYLECRGPCGRAVCARMNHEHAAAAAAHTPARLCRVAQPNVHCVGRRSVARDPQQRLRNCQLRCLMACLVAKIILCRACCMPAPMVPPISAWLVAVRSLEQSYPSPARAPPPGALPMTAQHAHSLVCAPSLARLLRCDADN
jgi:hypothetical protein